MYYINDSITSITTKWFSQLLQNLKWKLISCEVGVKIKNQKNSKFSKKNKIVVQIYWTHVRPVHSPAGAPAPKG